MKKTLSFGLCALALFSGTASATPSLKISNTITIGGDARWDYLYADSAQHRLYLSHGTQTEVIDTQTNKLLGTIADTIGVHGIAVANDLGLGFTSNGKDNSVTVFELASLKVLATIKVGGGPDAIIYVPQTQRVVTFNGKSKDATVIDAKNKSVLGTVNIGGTPEYAQLDTSGNVYFNIEDRAELAVLSSSDMKLTQRLSLKPCDGPSGLAVDKDQRFYSVCENKMMMVTAHDGKNIAQLPIGAGPDGVAWMDGYAYSANGKDGTLSVIGSDASGKLQAMATFPTAIGARTIAADTTTHRLYLPTADYKPAQSGGRRQGIPDTFRVLVIDVQ